MANKKQTTCKTASKAAKVLSSPTASKSAKSAAGSSLSQTRSNCNSKGRKK